ncbi:Protein of unknown function [Streptococcus gallolyticus]|uniref:DUF3290 domain-containing protein n=1 Tax=Streptococcus gallolyticus TaxID=315405 RepID=A0A1H7VMS8_9STRE|nr:DUF3290 domain-containing protein [Streptococcus gallolyticus]MCQ9216400.1 DUF3290 domain-containing protein [Streptococcus gallolyticus]MCY7171367.1 DUF3290 domain-containing protein [Streptococcus gallolyticus subsp. gallolyticus]MCY7186496.1 DUF3290 domain-containing protein [Streptococcus gallolyticus subsp. gallolyticus]SDK08183.1 Protein of unknown function [Streptococcus gallolyticus]SDL57561.1 Protein of unknown function [Streptococcus gallolyticus]
MNFYTLEYITQNQSFNLVFRSVILIILLMIVMLTSIHYMRNRIKTRLRDISIGIVVLMFILLGIQVEDYMQNNRDFSQSQILVKFIESVATDNDISSDDVLVNSTTLKDGIIVRYNEEDYTVHLNDDNNSYTLERTHVIDHHVYINGGE